VDGRTREVVGAEALVRWQHPERGLLAAGDFVVFAEEAGLVGAIGDWMLRAVVGRLAAWRDAGLGLPTIAVNLSARELSEPGLVARIAEVLALGGAGLPIELEVTETALVADFGETEKRLHELRALGVRVCLDDFGTGYSSLSHLRRFPIDAVKIDRSFVSDMVANRHDAAIVSAIVALSESLGLGLVGEGVETEAQAAALVRLGCLVQQGYLFSRPVPVEEFEKSLGPRLDQPSAGFSAAPCEAPLVH
jgi:EAL domain-containing protein (putative c-di-GMP-specific phosphodiesterase class I)